MAEPSWRTALSFLYFLLFYTIHTFGAKKQTPRSPVAGLPAAARRAAVPRPVSTLALLAPFRLRFCVSALGCETT